MKIQHSSPCGALYVPALGADIEPGVPVDAPESVAKGLLEQSDVWTTPEKAAKAAKAAEDAKAKQEAKS